jgi:hypothetical protein
MKLSWFILNPCIRKQACRGTPSISVDRGFGKERVVGGFKGGGSRRGYTLLETFRYFDPANTNRLITHASKRASINQTRNLAKARIYFIPILRNSSVDQFTVSMLIASHIVVYWTSLDLFSVIHLHARGRRGPIIGDVVFAFFHWRLSWLSWVSSGNHIHMS